MEVRRLTLADLTFADCRPKLLPLQQLRRLQHINPSAGRVGRQIFDLRFLSRFVLEAPHYHGFPASSGPQLGKSEDNAKPEKQGQHEHRTGSDSDERTGYKIDDVSRTHAPASGGEVF